MRDAFALAKEKAPAIIFIDEIDAIGTKRFDSEVSGDREVQRTMLELLNQLDGFASDDRIKARGEAPAHACVREPGAVALGRCVAGGVWRDARRRLRGGAGDRGHQPGGHSGPGAAAVGAAGPED